jgi:TonB family protein
MQHRWPITVLIAFLPAWAYAYAPHSPVFPAQNDDGTARVDVYSSGPDVTLPLLRPPSQSASPAGKCHNKQDARIRLSLIVDSQGRAHNIIFERPAGNPLDELALRLLDNDRFLPGTYQGAPSAVAVEAEVHMQACIDWSKKDSAGNKSAILRLHSEPEQKFEPSPQPKQKLPLSLIAARPAYTSPLEKVGPGVTPPRAIFHPEAEFSDYARQKKLQGDCVLGLRVDAHGMPQDIHITRSLEASLDQKAIEAVQRYRFTPAMKDGIPVPVAIAVEVRFRLY